MTNLNINEIMKLLPIMQAMAEGKTIQYQEEITGTWVDIDSNEEGLDFDAFRLRFEYYRIKPESTYRPFSNAEECWNEIERHQPFGWVKCKTDLYRSLITLVNNHGCFLNFDYKLLFFELFDKFTFADGTPFGIKIEN